jgi:hypothetical protein
MYVDAVPSGLRPMEIGLVLAATAPVFGVDPTSTPFKYNRIADPSYVATT